MKTLNLNGSEPVEEKKEEKPTPPPPKPQKTITKTTMDTPLEKIEEKLDLILKYQKHTRYMAILRGFVSFIFFFVFIIAPIIGGFYLVRIFNDNIDLDKVSSQYKEFYQTIESFRKSGDSLKKLEGTIKKPAVPR